MKTVLIVDDEKNLLESLKEGFRDHADDFTVITAEHGARASVILKSAPVDLVITDLKMPVMDGFELLAYMSKHHPNVPTIIMSAHGSRPDVAEKLKLFSASQYIQKPFELDELAATIIGKLKIGPADERQNGLTLPAFVQLISDEQRSCTLTAEFAGETGTLYFKNGELLDAETGALSGDEAVYYMATWDHATYDISRQCSKTIKKVSGTVGDLLMEGRARKDDKRAAPAVEAKATPEVSAIVVEAEKHARSASVQPAPAAEPAKTEQKNEKTTKEGNMATTREILSELAKMPNIDAVCLVARDGFLLDSIARTGIDREMIGAIASSGFGAADSMGRQLEKGKLQISMLEFEKGPVMLEPIGEDAFLVVVADKEANLGMIRLKLKKHGQELALAAAI